MRTVNQIIDSIKIIQGLDTDAEVAMLLGLQPGTLTAAKYRKSMPFNEIIEFAIKEKISLDWLFTGEGEMWVDDADTLIINKIKKEGILSERDLCYVINRVKNAYMVTSQKHPSVTAKAKWVVNLTKAFLIVLNAVRKSKNKPLLSFTNRSIMAEHLVFFQTHWPFNNRIKSPLDIDSFLELANESIVLLEKEDRVSCKLAGKIAGCFAHIILNPEDTKISDKTLDQLKHLLEPWCYWVAISSNSEDAPMPRDLDIFINEGTRETTDQIGTVTFEGVRDSNTGLLNGAFYFEKGVSIDFPINSLASLVPLLEKTNSNEFYIEKDDWGIGKTMKAGPWIKRNGVSFYPSKQEMNDFLDLVKKLSNSPDIKKEMNKALIETYGTL